MKTKSLILFLVFFFLIPITLFSAQSAKRAQRYKRRSSREEGVFNRLGGWFAILGKSEDERAGYEQKRGGASRFRRARKRARKEQKAARKRLRDAQKTVRSRRRKVRKESKRTQHDASIEPAPAPVIFTLNE